MAAKKQVLLIGGGMITRLQVLPSLFQMQRSGEIDEISICARRKSTLTPLLEDEGLKSAFPGQSFTPYPGSGCGDEAQPHLYKQLLDELPEGSVVYVAIPDQNHHEVLCETLERGHHVVCVKPLVLTHEHAGTATITANMG